MPQTAVVSGSVALVTGIPVLTTQPTNSGPWWLALIISGMGAAGTAFGALLNHFARKRRDVMDAQRELSNRLEREIGRLDEVCRRQQEEIDAKHAKMKTERDLKHDCAKQLQKLQGENDILLEKLRNCGVYINQLEFNLAKLRSEKNHA